ncbi:hypothetical protein AAVH_14779 [Aphelenchoides avenae]|nr:hypothetical protein AAVH_14779 [Aphelenchus avenae]
MELNEDSLRSIYELYLRHVSYETKRTTTATTRLADLLLLHRVSSSFVRLRLGSVHEVCTTSAYTQDYRAQIVRSKLKMPKMELVVPEALAMALFIENLLRPQVVSTPSAALLRSIACTGLMELHGSYYWHEWRHKGDDYALEFTRVANLNVRSLKRLTHFPDTYIDRLDANFNMELLTINGQLEESVSKPLPKSEVFEAYPCSWNVHSTMQRHLHLINSSVIRMSQLWRLVKSFVSEDARPCLSVREIDIRCSDAYNGHIPDMWSDLGRILTRCFPNLRLLRATEELQGDDTDDAFFRHTSNSWLEAFESFLCNASHPLAIEIGITNYSTLQLLEPIQAADFPRFIMHTSKSTEDDGTEEETFIFTYKHDYGGGRTLSMECSITGCYFQYEPSDADEEEASSLEENPS